jgi:hypothetical protein
MTADRDPDIFAELKRLGDDMAAMDEAAKSRARARLDEEIRRERSPRRPHAVWRPLAAAAAAALVAVASWTLLGPSFRRPTTRESAISQLAEAASTQPSPSVPAGSYVYTRSRVRTTIADTNITTGETETAVVVSRRETWIAPDGSGLILERPLGPEAGESKRITGKPGELRFPSLNRFPTEPHALLEAIRGPGFLDQPDNDFDVLSGIGALLRDPYVDPPHREALFLIVQGIEGVDVVEGYRDRLGRLGTALSLREGARSVTLVFEPRTSRLLEEGETNVGGTIYEATYLETGIVRAIGKRPGDPGA